MIIDITFTRDLLPKDAHEDEYKMAVRKAVYAKYPEHDIYVSGLNAGSRQQKFETRVHVWPANGEMPNDNYEQIAEQIKTLVDAVPMPGLNVK